MPETRARRALDRVERRRFAGKKNPRLRPEADATVERNEAGDLYPKFIRYPDGSSIRVDENAEMNEF